MMEKRIANGQFPGLAQRVGLELVSLLMPILVYGLVLTQPIPVDIAFNVRFDLFPWVLVFAILLFFALSLKGHLGRTVSLSLTLLMFALPVAALWNTGISIGYTLGGLMPWSDTNLYYWDARRLLQGEPLAPSVDHQRPLATGFLAMLLWLTQQNLQVTIALLVLIAAITSFLASRVLQRSHGSFAAVLLLVGLFSFYRHFAGSLMTETLGLSLGCLGFAALWQGARTRRMGLALAGLFFFSLGMNARVSAILILPMILVWGTWYFRQRQRLSWRFALSGTGAILLAFLLNGGVRKLIATPGSIPFSNFSYTLYGILTGGTWEKILQDDPALNQMTGAERVARAYELSWQVFQANPLRLVMGVLRGWQEFFWGNQSPFLAYGSRSHLDFWLGALLLVGLVTCWRQRNEAHGLLTLGLGLGVVLSMPLLPIWDAGLRPYATVMVIFFLIPALGLAFLVERLWVWCGKQTGCTGRATGLQQLPFSISIMNQGVASTRSDRYVPLGLGVLMTLGCTIAPVAIKATHHLPKSLPNACPPSLEARYYRINPGSSINLVRNTSRAFSQVPDIRIKDFRRNMKDLILFSEKTELALKALQPGQVLVDTFGYSWLVAQRSIVPQTTGAVVACGKLEQYPDLYLFKAESIQPLAPES